jgi:hypothetical protein
MQFDGNGEAGGALYAGDVRGLIIYTVTFIIPEPTTMLFLCRKLIIRLMVSIPDIHTAKFRRAYL